MMTSIYDWWVVKNSFVGGYTMTNFYLCKAMYQMMAYDLCLKREQNDY
jgi:hypothetical protein